MTHPTTPLLWAQPDALAQAQAWTQAELARQGISVTGAIAPSHIRAWSTVLRAPTDAGVYYFKAVCPAMAFEVPLTAALYRWRPDCMPQVLASDPGRGWLLLADSGGQMRPLVQAEGTPRRWFDVLPLYAEAQRDVAQHLPEMLSFGTPDHRLSQLPTLYQAVLDDSDALLIDQPGEDSLSAAAYVRARTLVPQVAALCQELAAYGIPETLQHDDFHDNNIFVLGERYTLADWGDACVAHPFYSTVVSLRVVAWELQREANDPDLVRLRDAYLEPWTALAPRKTLQAAWTLAQRLGALCRCLTYYHLAAWLPEPYKAEYASGVPGWLQEFLHTF